MRATAFLGVLCLLAAACSDHSGTATPGDAGRVRRVFKKPATSVRAVPPHAIRSEGVGPYLLGASLKDVLALSDRGPRVMLLELDGVLEYSEVEAEGGRMEVGVERGIGVSYVSVLDDEIARTEKGAGVGTTVSELTKALGSELAPANRLRDPRLKVYTALPNARFVVEDGQVVAVTVGLEGRPPPPRTAPAPRPIEPVVAEPPPRARCGADLLREHEDAVLAAARLGDDATAAYGCLDDDQPLLAVQDRDHLVVVTGAPGKLRRMRVEPQPDDPIVFAGSVDTSGDGMDELIAVTQSRSDSELVYRVEVYRSEGGRFSRSSSHDVYRITATSARWIGAELSQIDLLLDIEAGDETLVVGGLYIKRKGGAVVSAAPLQRSKLVVRASRSSSSAAPTASERSDAGPATDANEPARPAHHHLRKPPAHGAARDAGPARTQR